MSDLYQRLTLAYWPNPKLNESAHRESGDAAVDGLTIGEIAAFLQEANTGPTYCVVRRRVDTLMKMIQ